LQGHFEKMNIFTVKDIKINQFYSMHLKKYLLIINLFFVFGLFSQNQSNNNANNSNRTNNANSRNIGSATTQSTGITTLKHDTCLNKKFSIVVYVFDDSLQTISNNVGGILTAIESVTIASKINYLNNLFSRICVRFAHCSTVVIPHYAFERWPDVSIERMLYNNYATPNTINLFLPKALDYSPCLGGGYGYMPDVPSAGAPKLLVVSDLSLGGAELAHSFGHFFGLYHTHHEINSSPANPAPPLQTTPVSQINSNEFVDASNCRTFGDGICDTEADPYPANFPLHEHHVLCDYNGVLKDGKGKFYTPPFDNFMSFYSSCRCRFTQEQYNRMAYIIMTKRLSLH